MKYCRRCLVFPILFVALLCCTLNCYSLSAQNAVLYDPISGRTLLEAQSEKQGLIASTTKIMTALLVCENCNVLDQMRIPKEATGIEGSSMYLQPGESLSIQELLYGLMLSSGNDAAVALALYCSGSVEEFAVRMNEKAQSLGMWNTHFVNPHGLDANGHYSTAKDMAILASYSMKNPIFSKTVATKTVTVGNRYLRNHNKLLWLYPDANGVKTGYTRSAGRILVSSAEKNGRCLIAVTMNAPDDWQDHKLMYEKGFSQYNLQRCITAGDCIGYREVIGGKQKRVSVVAAKNEMYAVSKTDSLQTILQGSGFVYAPVAEGSSAGFAYILLNGNAVVRFPVIYGETVEAEDETGGNLIDMLLRRFRS